MNRLRALAVLCLLVKIPLSVAQTASASSTPANSPAASAASAAPGDLLLPTVVAGNQYVTTTAQSELDRHITVVLQGLESWMKSTGYSPKDLRLYLAGHKLTRASPTLASVHDGYVNFHLEIDPKDRDAWVQILYEAREQEDHKVPISVGFKDNMQAFDSKVDLTLMVYPRYTFLIIGLLVLLLMVTVILSLRTDLVRDGSTAPPPPLRLPYNLGRLQMAFWFYLVISAYLYVWLVTGEYNTVTNSVLALIGISAGTGVAAVLLDKQKAQEAFAQRVALETQQTALLARINELSVANPQPGSQLDQELQQKKNSLHEVQAQIAHVPAPPPPAVSRGFMKDILSSGEGVGFHRFQMAVWTVVFGIIFVRSVYRELAMPNFDTTLLGLMGLSSGTYIGFKIPEKPK